MNQVFLLLATSVLMTTSAQLCFKKGVLKLGELNFSFSQIPSLIAQIFQNIWLLSGMFLLGTSFILWLFILSKLRLNVAYPVAVSLEVSLTSIGAWFLFKEYLSVLQISGIIFVIAGIFLLTTRG